MLQGQGTRLQLCDFSPHSAVLSEGWRQRSHSGWQCLGFSPFQQGRAMSKDSAMLWNGSPSLHESSSFWWRHLHLKSTVWGHTWTESCRTWKLWWGSCVPWPWALGCLWSLGKSLDFCGCTAWVATLLMHVWGFGALAGNGFCKYKMFSRQNKLHSWAGVQLQLGSFCHSFIALFLVFKQRFS